MRADYTRCAMRRYPVACPHASRHRADGATPGRDHRLFKFLELPQVQGDLTAIATRAITELDLRGRVRNTAAPGWVHGAVTANASLIGYLRTMRRDLEYGKAFGKSTRGGGGGGGLGGGAAETAEPSAGVGRQLDGP